MSDKPAIDMDMLTTLMTLARGGDRNAQNILTNIFKVDHIQQKTNYPTAINQQKQTYLQMCVDILEKGDPVYGKELAQVFKSQSDWDSYTWQGYKGFLANNYTEMLKKGTDLSGIMAVPQPQQQDKPRFRDRFKKPKGEVLTE